MSKFAILLAFKVKQYYGPLRQNPSRLVRSFLQLAVLTALGGFAGYTLMATPGALLGGAAATASTSLSIFLALSLSASLSGGVTVFPSELDFILTSPVRPRTFLQASIVFQFVVFQFTSLPVIPFTISFAFARHYPTLWVVLALLGEEVFLLFAIQVVHALGILVSTGGRGAKMVVVGLIAALVFPAAGLVLPLPRFQDVPLPSTLFVDSLALPLGLSTAFPWAPLGFAAYFLGAFGALEVTARRRFLPNLRPNWLMSFGERIHPGVIRERLAARGRRALLYKVGHLKPFKGSITGLLVRLHLLRMVRQGSLFLTLGSILLLITLPAILAGPSQAGRQFVTSTVLYAGLVGPLLALAWNTVERENLWIPLTAGSLGRAYFQALFAASVVVSVLLPLPILALGLALAGPPPAWQVVALPLIALSSPGLALIAILRRPPLGDASPSLSPLGGIIVPVAGSYLISAPALATETAIGVLGTEVAVLALGGYTAMVGLLMFIGVGRVSEGVRG